MTIVFILLRTYLKKKPTQMIHQQNGYQKSQDTVVLFAKSELTKHVVSGGVLHLNMHGINSIVLCRLLP